MQGGTTPPSNATSSPASSSSAINLAAAASQQAQVKKDRPLLNITIPAYVTKLEDTKAGGKFLCNPCQSHCNSDIQLSQVRFGLFSFRRSSSLAPRDTRS